MPLSNEQKLVKLRRLANATDPLGVAKELETLEDKNTTLEQALLDAQNTFKEHINLIDGILHQLEDKKLDKEVFQQFGGEVKQALKTIQLVPGPKGERGERGEKPIAGVDFPMPRDGRDGRDSEVPGPKGDPGVPGKDGSPDLPEQIVDKLNTLEQVVEQNVIIGLVDEIKKLREEISRKPNQMTGMRKITSVRSVDLSGSVDGSATTFTLPQDTLKVLCVWSSQFPVTFRDGTDWTFAGRTLTLVTTQIGVPQTGQTLWALVETSFYAK